MVTASSSLINIFYNHFILVAEHGGMLNQETVSQFFVKLLENELMLKIL